jgi:phosphoesterase RecJ-like protein
MRTLSRQIHDHLTRAKRVILVVHQNPDGDALGSATALQEHLLNLGKNTTIWSATEVLPKYDFLSHSASVSSDPKLFTATDLDLIIVLDSGDLGYAGVDKFVAGLEHKIINIDHHPTNRNYGFINLVQPTSSSTSEMIYHFFKHNRLPINHRMATSLLTGIITDTDNFQNGATSINAFMAASDLIRSGGNINLINQWVVRNKTVNSLRLWGTVLSRLVHLKEDKLVYTYITREDIDTYQVSESESEGIANFLNNLDSDGASLILKEAEGGKIKGSFRTTRDDIDVSAWAKKLGGGGHKKAAGFTTIGTIEEVLKKLLTSR